MAAWHLADLSGKITVNIPVNYLPAKNPRAQEQMRLARKPKCASTAKVDTSFNTSQITDEGT